MKKGKYYNLLRLICPILIVAILSATVFFTTRSNSGSANKSENSFNYEPLKTENADALNLVGKFGSDAERISAMEKISENSKLELYGSKATADIAVKDKKTGEVWFSTPRDFLLDEKSSDETKAEIASLLKLTYFDTSSTQYILNSYEDCILKGQFVCEDVKNGMRINMQIGEPQPETPIPFAAVADRFKEKVIDRLDGMAKRRIEAFYTLYSYKDGNLDSNIKKRISEIYPGFKTYDLYIMREDASERDISLLTEYISKSDYTSKDYSDDIEKTGSTKQAAAKALFNISLVFTLENDGLKVQIPADSISYDTDNFALNKITVLEYFGAGKSSENGYLFIPDGSGSLINFNTDGTQKILSTVNDVYGKDYTLLQDEKNIQSISQQSYMPVFGIKENNKAFLGIIENGDAMAQIISKSGNIISGYETVAADFTYKSVQTYLYSDGKKQNGQWTYIADNYYDGDYCLKYKFLTGNNADYVGMAKAYREYMFSRGNVNTIENNESVPLYIDTVGLISKPASFLGIPYNKGVAITDFDDAQKIFDELKNEGIKNIQLRYKGWMNGGLNSSAPSKIDISSKLGGNKGFKALLTFADANGFSVFPTVDFSIVRNNTFTDGYSALSDAPHSNDDHIIKITPPEELNNISDIQNKYSVIKPLQQSRFYNTFFKAYEKLQNDCISISDVGNMLYSDFTKKEGTTRQDSLNIIKKNLENKLSDNSKLMVDGGNAYLLKHASYITNMPLSDSGRVVQDESIPFMQIALHGSVPYAGKAVNMSDDWKNTILKSAEYGANLHFTLGSKNTDALKETELSYLYSIDYKTWKEDVIKYYSKFNSVFSKLQDKTITDHCKLSEGVYKTTYEDGTEVAVNYNQSAVSVDGVEIPAEDFGIIN